jgi:hypothetical protein
MKIFGESKLVDQTGNPRHSLHAQERYEVGDDTYVPIDRLTVEQADKIEHELYSISADYAKHLEVFRKRRPC